MRGEDRLCVRDVCSTCHRSTCEHTCLHRLRLCDRFSLVSDTTCFSWVLQLSHRDSRVLASARKHSLAFEGLLFYSYRKGGPRMSATTTTTTTTSTTTSTTSYVLESPHRAQACLLLLSMTRTAARKHACAKGCTEPMASAHGNCLQLCQI